MGDFLEASLAGSSGHDNGSAQRRTPTQHPHSHNSSGRNLAIPHGFVQDENTTVRRLRLNMAQQPSASQRRTEKRLY